MSDASSATVSVIDTATLAVSGPRVAAGVSPLGLALTPGGGLLYVADTGADEVLVVDTGLLTVKGRIPLPGAPHGVAVSHDGKPSSSPSRLSEAWRSWTLLPASSSARRSRRGRRPTVSSSPRTGATRM
ncbi:hypothetical protein ABT040_35600 [Streptomyces sp. NPDC002688]|uniref:YncE family protein n=1 Tax=Streptomyces sp. NPDC002688 TaxID=3154423 RepID=UPI00331F5147